MLKKRLPRKILKYLLAGLLFTGYVYAIFLLSFISGLFITLAPQVSKESFLKLRPGMTVSELIRIVGVPIYETHSLLLGGYDGTDTKNTRYLRYARPYWGDGLGAGVTVQNDIIIGIGASSYDLEVYYCSNLDVRGDCVVKPENEAVLEKLNGCLFCRRDTWIGG